MRDFVLETLFFFFSCISFNSLKTIVLYGFGCFQWGKDTNLKANHNGFTIETLRYVLFPMGQRY